MLHKRHLCCQCLFRDTKKELLSHMEETIESTLENANSLHPHIITTVIAPPPFSSLPSNECWLDIVYELPASVFVDPNQLHDLADFRNARVFGETDLEAPLEHVREPRGSLVIVRRKNRDDRRTFKLDLPIHLRYQHPSYNATHRSIRIPPPKAGVTCGFGLPAIQHPLLPRYAAVASFTPFNVTTQEYDLELAVPVGRQEDATLVQIGTFVTVLACSAWIIWAILQSIKKTKRREAKGKRRKSQ